MDLNKLYNMDCLEGMKHIPDCSVDLVATDPPYILDNQGGGLYDSDKGAQYVKQLSDIKDGFQEAVLDELCRISKKINMYFFCSQKQIPFYLDYFVTKRGCNWNLLCWHKTTVVPACGNKYLTDTEYCLFFREKGVQLYGTFDTKKTYWLTAPNIEDKELWGHPTIKPLNIIQTLIVNSSQEGQTVLDPFMGSGTTAVAAIRTGRNWIGYEMNTEFYNLALKRIDETMRTPTLF